MNVDTLAFLRGLLTLFTLALLLAGCAASRITGSQPTATVLSPTATRRARCPSSATGVWPISARMARSTRSPRMVPAIAASVLLVRLCP